MFVIIKVFTILSIYWVFRGEWTRTQQTNLEQHIQDSRGRSYNSAASTQRSTVCESIKFTIRAAVRQGSNRNHQQQLDRVAAQSAQAACHVTSAAGHSAHSAGR
jgi:hypothetical protein